jgi:hypothetical protein
MRKLKHVKLFESFDQEQEQEQEVPFEFPHPVTIGKNVYHNTDELEKGENINLGSIMNTEDGLRFMSMSNKPEGLTLDELVELLDPQENEEMDDDPY